MSRLKKVAAMLAAVGTLALGAIAGAGATNAVPYNVEGGGGGCNPCSYIARVYIYYDGYWHWLNCEYLIFPWGTVQNKCW